MTIGYKLLELIRIKLIDYVYKSICICQLTVTEKRVTLYK